MIIIDSSVHATRFVALLIASLKPPRAQGPPYSFQKQSAFRVCIQERVYRDVRSQWDTYMYLQSPRALRHHCGRSCYFTDFSAGLQPAAGAGRLLHTRSRDVSVCIVIEWYNKDRSPWETDNGATWRHWYKTIYIYSSHVYMCALIYIRVRD